MILDDLECSGITVYDSHFGFSPTNNLSESAHILVKDI